MEEEEGDLERNSAPTIQGPLPAWLPWVLTHCLCLCTASGVLAQETLSKDKPAKASSHIWDSLHCKAVITIVRVMTYRFMLGTRGEAGNHSLRVGNHFTTVSKNLLQENLLQVKECLYQLDSSWAQTGNIYLSISRVISMVHNFIYTKSKNKPN